MAAHPPRKGLISLDFDGTILNYEHPDGLIDPVVIDTLNALAGSGITWCANSGRELHDQVAVVTRARQQGLTHPPAAYICTETTVHLDAGGALVSLEPWNRNAHATLRAFHARVQHTLGPQLETIRHSFTPTLFLVDELFTAFLLEDHTIAANQLAPLLEESLTGLDNVLISRNGGWVAVHHTQLGKGHALQAYADHAGYAASEILAIGDHHNDLPKLATGVAGHVGCPANAISAVQDAVRQAGGLVADQPTAAGTAAIIQAWASND
jgi:hydroxymethylpyrimidine pyrophosphatase-like HAD family hydrolase